MKKFNAVGAYIYAGGFTVGMEKHFQVLAHLEDGEFGVATVQKNMGGLPVFTNPKKWPLRYLKSRGCDVCYANPPCAPWSSAGNRSEVTLAQTTDHIQLLRLMTDLDPTIWVWESVPGAYTGEHDELSQFITNKAIDRGFSVYHFLHDSKFFGLPQQRRRVFTIASKVEIIFPVPRSELVTVGEALQSVENPGEIPAFSYKWQSYLPFVGQGERLRTVVLKAQDPPAPGFLIHRAHPDHVSRTLLGGVHVIHPWEDRFIGVNEAKALCGYPADYEFDRAGGDYFQQIAKAVTPVAGNYLGNALYLSLDANRPTSGEEWEVKYWAQSPRVIDERMLLENKRLR